MTAELQSVPVPFMKGRFNVYETPDGGFHIAYQKDGTEEIEHINLPGPLIRAAQMMSEGKLSPMAAIKMFMGKILWLTTLRQSGSLMRQSRAGSNASPAFLHR